MTAQKHLVRDLLRIVRTIHIESSSGFRVGAQYFSVGEPRCSNNDATAFENIVPYLAQEIYFRFYCKPSERNKALVKCEVQPPAAFVAALSEANCSHDRTDPGWKIVELLPTGHCLLHKSGLIQLKHVDQLSRLEARSENCGCADQVGILGVMPSQSLHSGFYHIYGETSLDDQDERDLIRFYWNLKASGAASLIKHLTVRLNLFEIPFRFKCLNDPAFYFRADAAVLYVNKRFYRAAAEIVRETYTISLPYLRASTPLFTKKLAPGIGFAEDPSTGESFGQNRSRLLAEALCEANLMGIKNATLKLKKVSAQLVRRGVDLSSPYLNRGSLDRYPSPFPVQ